MADIDKMLDEVAAEHGPSVHSAASGTAGPGRGGRMPAGSPTATAPDPATLAPMGRFAGGVDQVLNLGGNRPDQKLQGIHNAFVGGSEVAAPMALPALVAAPVATAGGIVLGSGAKLLGTGISRAMGASPDASEVIGDAASLPAAALGGRFGSRLSEIPSGNMLDAAQHLPWPIGQTVRAGRALFATPKAPVPIPFEPVRSNPAVAAKMRFGGPIESSGGPSYPRVGMSGAPTPEPTVTPAFRPNQVNPNIARNLRFTPSGDAGSGPASASIPSRVSGTPAANLPPLKTIPSDGSATPAYSGPNRVNPNIARNLRFTPSESEGSGSAASPATLGTRAEMLRQIRLRQQGIINPDDAANEEPRTFANGGIKLNTRRR